MSRAALTREDILDAAEDVLRRFGPSKATVVDVAHGLGVSHGSVYRHFASKAALRDAVTKRWLERSSHPLNAIARGSDAPATRLRRWFEALIAHKREDSLDDPELFATYFALAMDAGDAVTAHVRELEDQVAHIVADGITAGVFHADDARSAARAVLMATSRFHHPSHAPEWREPGDANAFDDVWALIARGLAV